MVATSNLPATLSLLTRHSAVSEDNVAEFLASLRHAWLQDVLSQVRSGKVHDWRMSSARYLHTAIPTTLSSPVCLSGCLWL